MGGDSQGGILLLKLGPTTYGPGQVSQLQFLLYETCQL